MTEKQIMQLQNLLSKSTAEATSDDFDQRVLEASKQAIVLKKASSNDSKDRLKTLLQPLGFIRTAILSVSLTLAIFVGMGQLLTFDHIDLTATNKNEKSQDTIQVIGTEPFKAKSDLTIHKPVALIAEHAPSQIQRDNALLSSLESIGLPETRDLLATMEFSVISERSLAQNNIDSAMDDIRSMIELGQFDDARERYVQLKRVQLKQHCPPCTLPDSLDDLLIAQTSSAINTG